MKSPLRLVADADVTSWLAARRKSEWICFLLTLVMIIGCTCIVMLAQSLFGLAITQNDGIKQINIRTIRFIMLAIVLAFLVLGFAIGITTKFVFTPRSTSTKAGPKKKKTEQKGGDEANPGDAAMNYTISYNGQSPWPPAYYPGAPGRQK